MLLLALSRNSSGRSESIEPKDAIQHIGSEQTVCGKVVGTYYARRTSGRPTFLNFSKPYLVIALLPAILACNGDPTEAELERLVRRAAPGRGRLAH